SQLKKVGQQAGLLMGLEGQFGSCNTRAWQVAQNPSVRIDAPSSLLHLLAPMKRTWLLFSQTVTILLAAYFVVATLKPQWLDRGSSLAGVSVIEAPASSAARGSGPVGSFSAAAK